VRLVGLQVDIAEGDARIIVKAVKQALPKVHLTGNQRSVWWTVGGAALPSPTWIAFRARVGTTNILPPFRGREDRERGRTCSTGRRARGWCIQTS
jgi:hypothetical protein